MGQTVRARANAKSQDRVGGIVKRSPSWAFGAPEEDENGLMRGPCVE